MFMLSCIDCGWYGDETELVSKTDEPDDKGFYYCPDCTGNNLEEEEEERLSD